MEGTNRPERRPVAAFPKRRLLAVVLLLLAMVVPGGSPLDAQERLRILVTNDDGYKSPGLRTLVVELAKIADVVVSAPDENKSGSSQSLGSLSGGVEVERVEIEGATRAYAVYGTPATAATFGIRRLGQEEPFDLVVSGINAGANVGAVSHVSGTVGAAMQAILLGLPAIAVSQDSDSRDYGVAARYTAKFVSAFHEHGWPQGVVLSINVPAAAVEAENPRVEVLPMGAGLLNFASFERLEGDDDRSRWRVRLGPVTGIEDGTDTASYLAGHITVTPLLLDWTAHSLLDPLSEVVPQP